VQNYLYCFDENYNQQALCSINSLLKNYKKEIRIFIVHKNPESFEKYKRLIEKNPNLHSLDIYKFDKQNIDFPNIEEAHVSEATYYRFFINEYLPKDIDEVFYLDADIICKNDPSANYDKFLSQLNNSKYVIAVKTEWKDNFTVDGYHDEFYRLDLTSKKYFNAGVMLINLNRWREFKIQEHLVAEQKKLKGKISLWDQDVLNSYFDGQYIELGENLNYNLDIFVSSKIKNTFIKEVDKKILNKIIFIHYSGKSKPWSVKGAIHPSSKFYHINYYELFKKRYHIANNWKMLALTDFLMLIKNGEMKRVQYKSSYFFNVVKYLFS
tara:strand:+ start:776 stop:1747 length:972 start_codon:yes stop_codon:yes gene_type:complete